MGKKTDILNDFFASAEGQKALKPDKKALPKKSKPPSQAKAAANNKKKGKKSKKSGPPPAAVAEAAPRGKSGKASFDLSSAGDLALEGNIDKLQETRIADPDIKSNTSAGEALPSLAPPLLSAEEEPKGDRIENKAPAADRAGAFLKGAPAAPQPAPEPPPSPPPPPPSELESSPKTQAQAARKNSAAAPPILSPHLQMSRLRSGPGASEEGSPFQLNLIQSESLRLAQNKIAGLEEELENQRRDNEKLSSGAGLLEESLDRLRAENEELRQEKEAAANDFANEKEVLLAAMEEGKKKSAKLKKAKKNLERRLSSDLQGIRARESALESKIEIMKIENSVVQKEKDKIIIDMKKEALAAKENLSAAQTNVQALKSRLSRVNENLRRTVSVLRATVNNLEGCRNGEDEGEKEEEEEEKESLKSA